MYQENEEITAQTEYNEPTKRSSSKQRRESLEEYRQTFLSAPKIIDRMHSYKNLQLMLGEVVRMQQRTNVVRGNKLTIRENGNLLRGNKVWVEGLESKDGSLFNSHIKLADDGKTIEVLNAPPQQEQGSQRGEQQPQQERQSQQDGSIISGGIDLFDVPSDGGDDPEETQFRNRMQQQQKKKRGRGI